MPISINQTGDGHSEIRRALKQTKASYELKEWMQYENPKKIVSIIFDGRKRHIIRTTIRGEQLKKSLKRTPFEVISYRGTN